MGSLIAVADTSPIIALTALGELHLLPSLFEELLVPFAVWDELAAKPGAPEPQALTTLERVRFVPPRAELPAAVSLLHAGEQQAIAVAVAEKAAVLLDDARARKAGAALGLKVVGALGILLEARRHTLIDRLEPRLTQLVDRGFRLSPAQVKAALRAVGEE